MKQLKEIRRNLTEIARVESMKLFRLAKRAEKHGCSEKLVAEIREEARWIWNIGDSSPEMLLSWEFKYRVKFAFKIEGRE